MQPFKNSPFAYGAGVARSEVQVDQGLRAFMLGVYNNMTVGLAISALVALGVNKLAIAASAAEAYRNAAGAPVRMGGQFLTPFGYTLYGTPLMWVVALAPLAFIFLFSFRMDRMAASTARTTFFAFAAVMGASLSTLLLRYTGASVVQVFFITAASFGALSLWGRRWLPLGGDLFVRDDGRRLLGFARDEAGRIVSVTGGSWRVADRLPD